MSITSFMLKRLFNKGDQKRDKGLTTPKDIKRYDDISYGKDPKFQLLDVYRPMGSLDKLPVIVSVHGGGWVYGDKDVYQHYCMSLAQRGFVVVNFSYRLAPKWNFPSSMEDTNSVFSWLLDKSDIYGFDLNNVFALGDSAGAQLLGMYSTFLTNEAFQKNFEIAPPAGLSLRGIALNCGVYDIDLNAPDNKMTKSLMIDLLGKKHLNEGLKLLNFMPYITSSFPPTYIMEANEDALINPEQAEKLKAVFHNNHISYKHKIYGDNDLPLNHVFHCDIKSDSAKICNDDECEFFKGLISHL